MRLPNDIEQRLAEVARCADDAVDPEVLQPCEHRMRYLLGAPDATASPGELDALQRAAVAFTEQFVIDVASMNDELVSELTTHLGQVGLVDFTHALLAAEQRIRIELMLDRLTVAS